MQDEIAAEDAAHDEGQERGVLALDEEKERHEANDEKDMVIVEKETSSLSL